MTDIMRPLHAPPPPPPPPPGPLLLRGSHRWLVVALTVPLLLGSDRCGRDEPPAPSCDCEAIRQQKEAECDGELTSWWCEPSTCAVMYVCGGVIVDMP